MRMAVVCLAAVQERTIDFSHTVASVLDDTDWECECGGVGVVDNARRRAVLVLGLQRMREAEQTESSE